MNKDICAGIRQGRRMKKQFAQFNRTLRKNNCTGMQADKQHNCAKVAYGLVEATESYPHHSKTPQDSVVPWLHTQLPSAFTTSGCIIASHLSVSEAIWR
ncbi:MAG: hypothetical protein ACO3PV_07770 [Pseudohongiellaceae bacterium]